MQAGCKSVWALSWKATRPVEDVCEAASASEKMFKVKHAQQVVIEKTLDEEEKNKSTV